MELCCILAVVLPALILIGSLLSYRTCPLCKQVVHKDATRCQHCHGDIGDHEG